MLNLEPQIIENVSTPLKIHPYSGLVFAFRYRDMTEEPFDLRIKKEWQTYGTKAFILTFHQLIRAEIIKVKAYTWKDKKIEKRALNQVEIFEIIKKREEGTADILSNDLLQLFNRQEGVFLKKIKPIIGACIDRYIGEKKPTYYFMLTADKENPYRRFITSLLSIYYGSHDWIDEFRREKYFKLHTTAQWFFKESVRREMHELYHQLYFDLKLMRRQNRMYHEFIHKLEKEVKKAFWERSPEKFLKY